MDAWGGNDDRDFDPTEAHDCDSCGAGPDEACDRECQCDYCTGRRAREAAMRALDVTPDEAA